MVQPTNARPQPAYIEFFTYATTRFSIAPAATPSQNITIQNDADFLVDKITYAADNAGAAQTDSTRIVPNISVQLITSGSGKAWSNTPVMLPGMIGYASLPFILTKPYLLYANTTLTINFQSFEAANTYNLQLLLHGRKLYYTPPGQ